MKTAQAGTLESSDIMITLSPQEPGDGVKIDIDSNVLHQYGEAIQAVIASTLAEAGVKDVWVKAVDRGALDYTIKARLLTALDRARRAA
ncbi:citrate lyase subunit gamma (acyl carrier protein) [Formivibrio citricus]|uniref:Citrate lyase subunit gamma (Acyl carrier protein) n=1 Tax=Formivibrio citricus TaxID=83765 RepID=A0A1I4VML8_9NEIS|nr:citrate lyase acyl carrier protein [Formivibrio citricus]SFN02514.1 citrate lyase subunit gamma (acyl carrier protein) [Formivibrio citricus]